MALKKSCQVLAGFKIFDSDLGFATCNRFVVSSRFATCRKQRHAELLNGHPKGKNPRRCWATGVFWCNSLTMTYFHTGCSTIIGAKSFHGPVRDGKGWYQLAMVIRHDWSVPWRAAACICTRPAHQATQTGRSSRYCGCGCAMLRRPCRSMIRYCRL
jgi:hypothetical protein